MKLRETEAFKIGALGETKVRAALQQVGWFVIPSADFYGGPDNEHAPALQGNEDTYVLPDLDVAAGGKRFWAEVKTKAEPAFYKKHETWVHGYGLRKFMQYREVEKRTGCQVWTFVWERCSGEILYGSLTDLTKSALYYHGDKQDKGGMIYFPRVEFRVWGGAIGDFQDILTSTPPEPVDVAEVKAAADFKQMRLL